MTRRPRPDLNVVLLAGGSGTRFWPLSRAGRPKQFLHLLGDRSLLRATWDRARALAPASRIWVVAPASLSTAVRRDLPALRRDRIVVEPAPRDTAPALALACAAVARLDPEAIVAVLPTDHVIGDARAFVRAIRVAAAAASRDDLVCLGVRPTRPATGFGYLETRGPVRRGTASPVKAFVEKPQLAKARRFLRSGRHLWNAGIFVWKAGRFLDELDRCAPGVRTAAETALDGKHRAWRALTPVSVDYAVMERARGVMVVAFEAGWDDVGSWEAAARLIPPSSPLRPQHVAVASDGSVVIGRDRFVALVGVPGIIVVDTPDALLVAARDGGEAMRSVVAAVRKAGRGDLA
ncbi:MAG TPA: sugar phosphate nucleotidyltransferase [Candidatus Polarisedimenticolaceae bacterium]|nr:sugar phosphate nucleotidyltransferase [Candidatus Polarisedimenticolaceae bacterium]